MKRTVTHICSFSEGIDELKGKQLTIPNVLRILKDAGRFSVFEATANDRIARLMDRIQGDLFVVDRENSHYPWLRVILTDKGEQCLAEVAQAVRKEK